MHISRSDSKSPIYSVNIATVSQNKTALEPAFSKVETNGVILRDEADPVPTGPVRLREKTPVRPDASSRNAIQLRSSPAFQDICQCG